jgi:acyl-coenzyme A synthetase/AMP-(fatty) acid ligase
LFLAADGEIEAGRIRASATAIAAQIKEGDNIYLFTESASLFVAGLLAATQKNSPVSCPAHLQPSYLREIGAGDGVVLTDRQLYHMRSIHLTLSEKREADAGDGLSVDPDIFFYTSGVTGKPKAVRKSIRQLDAEAGVLATLWPRGARRVFGTVSHQHIYGMLFRIFWPVLAGGTSADLRADYWEQLADKLSPGTTLVSSPAHLTRLPPMPAGTKPDLIFSSGAILSYSAALSARKQFGSFPVEVLGSTETGGIAWRRQENVDSLWNPLPGVEIEANGDEQLCVHSPFADPQNLVSTGDLFEREGTKFRLKGRGDRVAKIDGKRVSLVRVENALLALPIIEAAAAVDLPERNGALGALVQLNAEGQAVLVERGAFRLSRDLRHALAERLEPAERPKHWHFGSIPLDRQGKQTQSLLRAAFDRARQQTLGRGRVQNIQADSAAIIVELMPDMIWFQGHFPAQPILAGIAQVHMAALWAEQIWGRKAPDGNLSHLKFRRLLRPGDIVQLKLVRLPEKQRLRFSYTLNEVIASEGTIEEVA